MKRKDKREKISTVLCGIGLITFMIFGSAIDGPGNDMRIVYGGLAAAATLFLTGAEIGGWIEW